MKIILFILLCFILGLLISYLLSRFRNLILEQFPAAQKLFEFFNIKTNKKYNNQKSYSGGNKNEENKQKLREPDEKVKEERATKKGEINLEQLMKARNLMRELDEPLIRDSLASIMAVKMLENMLQNQRYANLQNSMNAAFNNNHEQILEHMKISLSKALALELQTYQNGKHEIKTNLDGDKFLKAFVQNKELGANAYKILTDLVHSSIQGASHNIINHLSLSKNDIFIKRESNSHDHGIDSMRMVIGISAAVLDRFLSKELDGKFDNNKSSAINDSPVIRIKPIGDCMAFVAEKTVNDHKITTTGVANSQGKVIESATFVEKTSKPSNNISNGAGLSS